jgi:hypothetical protein
LVYINISIYDRKKIFPQKINKQEKAKKKANGNKKKLKKRKKEK